MQRIGILLSLFFFASFTNLYGQKDDNSNYFPLWTYHQKDVNIHGISLGLWSFDSKPRYTNTNGVKVELIGVGLLMPLIPESPIAKTDSAFARLIKEDLSERINGFNLSASGSVCHCLTNGLAAGAIGQIHHQVNGISTAGYLNFVQKQNGLMVAIGNDAYYMNGLQIGFWNQGVKTKGIQMGLVSNYAEKMRGVQMGLFNKSENFRGIQIGLWNVNQKRKLPLINWNFKKEKRKAH